MPQPHPDLQTAIAAHRHGPGRRFPAEVRAAVVEHAERQREQGQSWRRIAEGIGLRTPTVRRWCEGEVDDGATAALVPVELVASRPSGLCIVTPHGLRIEGLGVDDVVRILGALA